MVSAPSDSYGLSSAQISKTKAAFSDIRKNRFDSALQNAEQSGSPHIASAVMWHYLTDKDAAPPFYRLSQFINQHPDWPAQEKLLIRAEQALAREGASAEVMQPWFTKHPPKTAWGELKWAEARNRVSQATVRRAWVNGDFSSSEEKRILQQYAAQISTDIHAARADRLLWENKPNSAASLKPYIAADYRTLIDARVALQKRHKGVNGKIAAVAAKYKNDAGLKFDRMVWRKKAKNLAGVEEILLQMGKKVPYASKWWSYRKRAIREALESGQHSKAEKLADNHGQTETFELSEALWMQGWTALSFRNQPRKALPIFERLYKIVSFPISKSRGAYWAGRAAKQAGDARRATRWYRIAAKYNDTFYGQLAHEEVFGKSRLKFATHPHIQMSRYKAFVNRNSLAKAIQELGKADIQVQALTFIKHLADQASSAEEAAMVAHLGTSINRPDFALRASKNAGRKGFFLQKTSYPILDIPENIPVEAELAYAIMRQESSFYPRARSSADARGMMQLLPSTAKAVARRNGIPHSKEKLYQPQHNIRLGTHYLDTLIDRFGPAYALVAAGYNAGPGRPASWLKRFPVDRSNQYAMINWIEMIPFSETRNYVMRILENYQVYRSVISGGSERSNAHDILTK